MEFWLEGWNTAGDTKTTKKTSRANTTKGGYAPLQESDHAQWEEQYRGYITFYERQEPQTFYDANWARLLEDNDVHGLVARDEDDNTKLLGLVHFIPHPSMSGDMCYLQDLFTHPDARGEGVGAKLMEGVVEWCRKKGVIKRVYWNTHETNPARRSCMMSWGCMRDL